MIKNAIIFLSLFDVSFLRNSDLSLSGGDLLLGEDILFKAKNNYDEQTLIEFIRTFYRLLCKRNKCESTDNGYDKYPKEVSTR